MMTDLYRPPSSSTDDFQIEVDDAIALREALLEYEAAVLGLGWWFYFLGLSQLLLGAASVAMMVILWTMGGLFSGEAMPGAIGLVAFTVLLSGFGGLCTYSAWGVRSGAPEARLPALINSGIMVLNFPFGMIAGAAGLYLLLLPQSTVFFTHKHAHVRASTPTLKARWHPLLLALPVTIGASVLGLAGLVAMTIVFTV